VKWLCGMLAAFRFLTVFPLPGTLGTASEDLRRSLWFFPLVGLVLGILAAAGAWLAWRFFPPAVAAVSLVFLLPAFSGALHLDGLADSADGLFSSRGREQVLEIMRDSRIGVMGVVAVVMVLLFKSAAFFSMPMERAVAAALLAPVAGRCAMVLMIGWLPYARTEGGLATVFYAGRSKAVQPVAAVLLVICAFAAAGGGGLRAAAAALAAAAIFSLYCRRRIGGSTGDTLGGACELAETAVIISLAV
jgi:adenosylcobinamide-GDP ribazoletransferase